MPYFVTLDITDGKKPRGHQTFAQADIEVGSFGDVQIEDDDFENDDFHIHVLPEGVFLHQRWSDDHLKVNGALVKGRRQLAVGDVITQGGESRIELVAMGEEGEMPSQGSRYVAVKILDKCPHCGSGLPMNGPLLEVPCGSCSKSCHPKPEYWESALEDSINEYSNGGGSFSLNFQTNVSWRATPPTCSRCDAPLPADEVPTGSTEEIPCPSCGALNSTCPAPEWLTAVLPSVKQVFNAEREGGDDAEIETSGVKPVILSCPSCNGSLKITSASDRTVTCQFCDSDVYLPDDLWTRLHPKKTATTWYFRLEGKTKKQLELEKNRQQKIEELRSEAREAKQSERIDRTSNALGWLIPLGITVIVSVIVVASIFGDTLFEDSDASDSRLAAIAQTAPGAQNWSADQLAPSRVNVNNQWFSMYAPQGPPTNDGKAIVWSDTSNGQGRASLYVRVAQVRTPATLDAAKQMASAGQQRPLTAVRSGQIPSGWSLTLQPEVASRLDVVVYRTKQGAPLGSPGLECRAILQTNDGTPLTLPDQAEAYLNQICGSINPE